MINKRFERILRTNTRQDFKSKFLIDGDSYDACIYSKDGDFECECPYVKSCNPSDDCIKCWEDSIKNSKFKDEV